MKPLLLLNGGKEAPEDCHAAIHQHDSRYQNITWIQLRVYE